MRIPEIAAVQFFRENQTSVNLTKFSLPQHYFKIIPGYRFGIKETLNTLASYAEQKIRLFERFNTFSYNWKIEPLSHSYDGCQNETAAFVAGAVLHEPHIKLDNIEINILENIERSTTRLVFSRLSATTDSVISIRRYFAGTP